MKQIKMCVLLASILGAFFVCKTKDSNSIYNEVELNNIEALASNEIIDSNINSCFETGSVECDFGGYGLWISFKLDRDSY